MPLRRLLQEAATFTQTWGFGADDTALTQSHGPPSLMRLAYLAGCRRSSGAASYLRHDPEMLEWAARLKVGPLTASS